MAQRTEGMGFAVKSNAEIMHTLGRLGLKRLATSVMWVLKVVFNMPEQYMICEPDKDSGEFLMEATALNEIDYLGQNGWV